MKAELQTILSDLEYLTEWLDKYNYLIELADTLPPLAENLKTPENLIKGCQSRVWIVTELNEDGKMHIAADSDAIIVRGIIALLVAALSGLSPQEIIENNFEFLKTTGLKENLSPTRAGGLEAMVSRINEKAQQYLRQ